MRELNGDWKDLFRLFRVSLHIPKLLLSAFGLIFSFFSVGAITYSLAVKYSPNPGELKPDITHINDIIITAFELPISSLGHLLRAGNPLPIALFFAGSFVALVAIWAYFGTAISRIAALEITRDERIEVNESLAYTRDHFKASFMSFFLPIIGFAIFWIVIWLVALLVNVPVINILVMFGLPLAILGGFIMVLILVGSGGGFPLFIPAISVEGTDSFDAISRGFSYVLSRSWHYIWNWIVALAYGGVCTLFVLSFAYMIQFFVNYVGSVAINESVFAFDKILNINLKHANWITWVAGTVYYFWIFIFQALSVGFAVSFFFCSSTMIYLLMRKRVDGIDMEEVYEERDEDEEFLFEEESDFEEEFDEEEESDDTQEEDSDSEEETEEKDEQEESEQDEFDCPEPDCDRSFDSEFGRDQHHRMMHQDDDEE